MRSASAALLALLAGCKLLYDFTLVAETEVGALCADGVDNDFSGLSDCQEWTCLDERACCDIPEIVVDDEFEAGPAVCPEPIEGCEIPCARDTCPDPERWHAWPCPYATVCEGALRPAESGLPMCLPVGVLGRDDLALEPGLAVTAGLLGAPAEVQGFLEVGLTLQSEVEVPGATDPCATASHPEPFVSLLQRPREGGSTVVARFLGDDVGSADLPLDETVHEVGITIQNDRRVSYLLDGRSFAVAEQPLPETERQARVVLFGLTRTAGFASVRVVAGRRCDSPVTWTPRTDGAGSFVALGLPPDSTAWDRDNVIAPSARLDGEGGVELYYTGCRGVLPGGECEPLQTKIGRATGALGGALARDDANPLFGVEDVPWPIGTVPETLWFRAIDRQPPLGYASISPAIFSVESGFPTPITILERDPEGWDASLCCALGIRRAEDNRLLFYAARAGEGEPWRIGLATSRDGVAFTKHPENPVLREGPPEAFDGRGVRDPSVLWDAERAIYRMWYVGEDFFGGVAIGYAVSQDGVVWSKAPENPVLRGETVGLTRIGSPSVVLDPESRRLTMWLEGELVASPGRQIFVLENDGMALPP